MFLKAVIYCRVSTKKQVKSLDNQELICRDWCKRNNIEVVAVFRDVCPGDFPIDNRPGLKKLIEFIKSRDDITHLVVYSLDRLARSRKILYDVLKILLEKKIRLVDVFEEKIYDPESFFTRPEPLGICKRCLAKLAYRLVELYLPYVFEPWRSCLPEFAVRGCIAESLEIIVPELREYLLEKAKKYFPDLKLEEHERISKILAQFVYHAFKTKDTELALNLLKDIEQDINTNTQ